MSSSGFFTRGVSYDLPHPHIDERLVLIIHEVIGYALQLLRAHPPSGFDLSTAVEDTVTVHLQHVVESLRKSGEVRGFNQRSFGRVWREPKVVSFNMGHLDKMPDLVFHLNRDSLAVFASEDGLFVECKPVDGAHPAGKHYCDSGLRRFIDGEYAWAMQEALMVAYVRDGRTIPHHLTPALNKRQERLTMESPATALRGSVATARSDALHFSTHSRAFCWPAQWGRACAIRVYHSWHSCS